MRPLTGTLGAEVRGVDLRRRLDDATVAELRALWLGYMVLFFSEQFLSPEEQAALARRFGPVTPAHPVVPGALADLPDVLVLDIRRMRASREYAPTEARSREAG